MFGGVRLAAAMQGFDALAVTRHELTDGDQLFTAVCHPDLDLALFPDLARALDYWNSKRRGRPMPNREDLDPAEMVEFLPRVMLADVERQPLRFRYRLCGTGICQVHPGDPTRLTADQLQPGAYGRLVHGQYRDVLESGRPAMHLNVFDNHHRYRSYAHLILPLSRTGENADMIMTVDSLAQDQAEMLNLLVRLQRRAGIELSDVYLVAANRTT
jgi:hypothetical protein